MLRFRSRDGASKSSLHMSQENVNSSTMKSLLRRRPVDNVSVECVEFPVDSFYSKNASSDASEKVFLKYFNLVPTKRSGTDVSENRSLVHVNSRRKLCDKSNRNFENHDFILRINVGPDFKVKDNPKWIHTGSSNGGLKILKKQEGTKVQWLQTLKSIKQKRVMKSNVMQSMSNQQLNQSRNFLWSSKTSSVPLLSLHKDAGSLSDWKHQVLMKRQADLRQETQKFVDKDVAKVEICSPLGQRLLENVAHCRTQDSKEECVRQYELSCATNYKQIPYKLPGISNLSCVSTCGSSRTLRSNNVFNGDNSSWSPHCSTHSYTFSKTERLNKWAFLETGLNWKGRILSWSCSPVTVDVMKMDVCPYCHEKLMPGNIHSCNSADSQNDTDSDYSEENDDSSEMNEPLPSSLPLM